MHKLIDVTQETHCRTLLNLFESFDRCLRLPSFIVQALLPQVAEGPFLQISRGEEMALPIPVDIK